jgi:hypothetical protein
MGPFDIVDPQAFPDVKVALLSEEYTTIESAGNFVGCALAQLQRAALLVVMPTFAKFPDFDGFVVYRREDGKSVVYGYQCKPDRAYPKRAPCLEIHRALIVRGNAVVPDSGPRGWEAMGEKEMRALLGYSLGMLYPTTRSSAVENDAFD